MDSKKKFIEQINDFKQLGINKINDTKNYLGPVFKKGTDILIKAVSSCLVKAGVAYKELETLCIRVANACGVKAAVAYKELEPVVIRAVKNFATVMQTGAKNAVERIEAKFGKIHFDFRHFVMTSGVAVVVFALTFTVTGMNRSKVSAAVLEPQEVEAYNNEVIEINYGDDSAIVDVVKDILADDTGNVNNAEAVTLADGSVGYEIGNYVVEVEQEPTKELKEDEITIKVQTKETYVADEFGKVEITEPEKVSEKVDGAVYTYKLDVQYVDTQAPVINLKTNEVEIDDVDNFNPKKFVNTIADNYDGDITNYTIDGEVEIKDEDRWEPGEYTLVYKAKDSNGNVGEAKLKVIVNETEDEEEEAEATEVSSTDYNTDNEVNSAPSYENAGSIVAAAMAQIGVAQDCTMLVTNSLRAVGINFHSAPAGYMSLGTIVSVSEAQPGDIIYYADGGAGVPHVAIYIGGGQAVHGGYMGTTRVASAWMGSGFVVIRVQ
ncbi:hypothetical protein M2475_001370 [Breznakia sp. PF5-3]|uniref:C40 family peptidase n=1 Tax=unclassified Breznakia TaxID=2623764 RepID=UPI002406E829|nr:MULTISPECIES: NlpC/P60 family protein [unclassified Breznakia]MDF9824936.1 hypothetical protein [Breznakia sp. PM6-1]MDF9835796.1 hypothetical protein [Breznakia sp. PF5-3]MDF9837910.1 hypothetical protein [Breznakia sp. PFB2-8]MDF9859899.1 hypothetical protein [Breznakia sp. PH5-24]